MPVISVDLFPGKTRAQKREFVAAVTAAAVEHLGVEAEGVIVLLRETPAENWGWSGRLFTAGTSATE